MGIFDWLIGRSRKGTQKKSAANAQNDPIDTARLDQIADFVQKHFSKPFVRIRTVKDASPEITDSKFGGYPYWEIGRDCLYSSGGQPLVLLAQINFEKEALAYPPFPQTGILQFFIRSDDMYGANLNDPTRQDSFRVVYHPTVDNAVTVDTVMASGMPANTQLDKRRDAFPLYSELKITFERGQDSVSYCAEPEYEAAVSNALKVLFDEELQTSVFAHFSHKAYDYLAQKLCVWGHKLGGYPNFTQWDPRSEENAEIFDTLLFQMDSEQNDILWGDSGVANFFINHESLKALDFSQVLYNWDCY